MEYVCEKGHRLQATIRTYVSVSDNDVIFIRDASFGFDVDVAANRSLHKRKDCGCDVAVISVLPGWHIDHGDGYARFWSSE